MIAGVWSLLAVAEPVGVSGAAVITTMLTTLEACPSRFEVMEVKVWVGNSPGIVAPVVTLTVASPER